MHMPCYVFGVLPRYDSEHIPTLNSYLQESLRQNYVGLSKSIKLGHVDKKDRVHLRTNAYFLLAQVINKTIREIEN